MSRRMSRTWHGTSATSMRPSGSFSLWSVSRSFATECRSRSAFLEFFVDIDAQAVVSLCPRAQLVRLRGLPFFPAHVQREQAETETKKHRNGRCKHDIHAE